MNPRTLWVSSALAILMASCAPEGQPRVSIPEEMAVQDVAPFPDPDAILITESPEPDTAETPTEVLGSNSLTISCPGALTPAQQEGPYYLPGSPERNSLIEEGMEGTPILIVGRVFDADCAPIPDTKLDFWLADVDGQYDNTGYTLRGHLYTDEDGYYSLESIEPTPYTGRPPHIHVKVFAPDGHQLLTTQMYFTGSDASLEIVSVPELAIRYLDSDENGRLRALFSFVVEFAPE